MRILIHDYPGHPFQVELSRELARRNYNVKHLYAGYNITPRGELLKNEYDPSTFEISPIFIRNPLEKYSFLKRWVQEREYGKLFASEIINYKPDIIISSNTPLDVNAIAQKVCKQNDISFIFWLQDVIGLATRRLLRNKLFVLGDLIGRYYEYLERILLRSSNHIVLITEDFCPFMTQWNIPEVITTVIPNWAPLESVTVLPKNNSWSQQHDITDKFCFMYTGTLGMKHNPSLLLRLALEYQSQDNIKLVVVSEGPGADWLKIKKAETLLKNLIILPYQPFSDLPKVMATADVLIALLELEAGVFSVPSKVLTYLCAKRPILLAVPPENLAARIVSQYKAGIVVSPDDLDGFVNSAKYLAENGSLRDEFALNGRKYAEDNFDIKAIGDRFEEIINGIR